MGIGYINFFFICTPSFISCAGILQGLSREVIVTSTQPNLRFFKPVYGQDFYLPGISDEISGIYVSSSDYADNELASYLVLLNDRGLNFNSICLDLDDTFLAYDSTKIRVAYDSCNKDGSSNDIKLDDDTSSNGSRVIIYSQHSCYNYELIVELLQSLSSVDQQLPPTTATSYETGENGYLYYYCKTVKKSFFSITIPVLNATNLNHEDLIHIVFKVFTIDINATKSSQLNKFASISDNHIANLLHNDIYADHVYKYCYTKNSVSVPYIKPEYFSILPSSRILISSIPSAIHYGYVLPDRHGRLDCFFSPK